MEEQENNSCNMVGLVGVIIQISLGVLSFSVLIVKRFLQENPRPWKIWIFDTSKQLVSQFFAHFINLTISIALTYKDNSSDQCLWYFTTNILDNTIGVLICIFCLVNIERYFTKKGKFEYVSGNYYFVDKVVVKGEYYETGQQKFKKYELKQQVNLQLEKWGEDHQQDQPKIGILNQQLDQTSLGKQNSDIKTTTIEKSPQQQGEQVTHTIEKHMVNYKAWLVQLGVWISIVIIGKSILFGLEFGLEDPLKNVTFTTMGWIQKFELLELFVVIVIVPVVMNGLAFWIQDNFLMRKDINSTGQNIQQPIQQQIKTEAKEQSNKEHTIQPVESQSHQI